DLWNLGSDTLVAISPMKARPSTTPMTSTARISNSLASSEALYLDDHSGVLFVWLTLFMSKLNVIEAVVHQKPLSHKRVHDEFTAEIIGVSASSIWEVIGKSTDSLFKWLRRPFPS